MDRFFKKKLITIIIIMSFLFVFSVENFIASYEGFKSILIDKHISFFNLDESARLLENAANEGVYGKYNFIDAYGYLQKLMGKNEENNFEVIKDKNGFLHYTFITYQANPVYNIAVRTEAFKYGMKNKSTKFIYLMPPDKYIKGYTKLPIGIPYNYNNETADDFLDLLNKKNIDTIDLREGINFSGIPQNELFFKTDHHWKIETVFWAFGKLVDELNTKYNMNLDKDNFYTNKENYNFIKYENSYIGSLGRKTGKLYSGTDDFSLIYPKFKTSYICYTKTGEQEATLEGRFEDALLTISPFRSKKGTYALEEDKYSAYLFGNRGVVHVTNKDNLNGPKILLIKDSLSVPLSAFLSTVCSEIYLVDPRYYKEDIPDFVNTIENLDVVFIAISPSDLTEEFFPFYETKQ